MKYTLVSTPAHPISAKALLSRVEKLFHELSSLEQDSSQSLDDIKDQLVDRKLLRHSNRGIQAYVACCVCDILRLYAPDAPYNASQLTDVFRLFMRQLKQLKSTDSGFFHQQKYLLTRMAEVKLSVLMTDLPDSEKLVEGLFEAVYEVVEEAKDPLDEETEQCFEELLTEVITESSSLSQKCMKLIMNKFLQHSKRSSALKGVSVPGFAFTLKLCAVNSDRLSRLVTLFFSEMIYEMASNDSLGNSDLAQLSKIHLIMTEIWCYVPGMLASVTGLLLNEFDADDRRIRVLATQTVAKMLQKSQSSLNFVRSHREVYASWIKKTLDVSPSVRVAWINTTGDIVAARSDLSSDLRGGLVKTLIDADERVRLAAVKELASIKSSVFVSRLADKSIMGTLRQLLREKHEEIRNECIRFLAKVYNETCELSLDDEAVAAAISRIPDDILNLVYINDKSINCEVDLCLFDSILPTGEQQTDQTRVARLLQVVANLSDKGRSVLFLSVVRRQCDLSVMIPKLLDLVESWLDSGDDSLEPKIDKVVDYLAADFPADQETGPILKQFLRSGNRRLFRLIRLCCSSTTDYSTVCKSIEEILGKVDKTSIKLLLYRCSSLICNKSNVPAILQASRDSNESASKILDLFSTYSPAVLKANISDMIGRQTQFSVSELKALYNFVKVFPSLISDDSNIEFFDRLVKISAEGTPKEAKYAIRIISASRYVLKSSALQDILDSCWPLDVDSPHLNTQLAAIAELFLADPILMEPKVREISEFLASEILLKNATTDEVEGDWISDEDLLTTSTSCHSKILALKVFTNWLVMIDKDEHTDIDAVATPVFKLLNSIITNGGEIVSSKEPSYPTPKLYQSRLRLEAGLRLLRLAQCPSYEARINQETLSRLVFLIQDESTPVRKKFVRKLSARLTNSQLPTRFVPLMFFIAHEPNKPLKEEVSTWIRASFKRQLDSAKNSLGFETSYVRLIYMLSHHDQLLELYHDWEDAEDGDKEDKFSKVVRFALAYIVYALGLICNKDNISLLFYLTQRIKQFQDATTDVTPESLYFVADLAMLALTRVAENRVWNISTWPGKFALPSDLYTKNRDLDSVKDVISTSYIPERYSKRTQEDVRDKCRHLSRFKSSVKRTAREEPKRKVRVVEVPSELPNEHPTRRSRISRRLVDYRED